jgi:hypothetical protein
VAEVGLAVGVVDRGRDVELGIHWGSSYRSMQTSNQGTGLTPREIR